MSNPTEAAQLLKVLVGNPFSFPEVWHTVAYASSMFVFIPAVVIIMLITNEYSYRTLRQNIVDGWSRSEFIMSKLIDVIIITLLITFLYIIVCIVIGSINSKPEADIFNLSYYTGLFALQTFAQLSIAFLIGFLIKKAFISLGVFIFYFFPLEPVLALYSREKLNDIGKYLPLEISDRIIPVPAFIGKLDIDNYKKALAAINEHIIYTILLTSIIWFICFWINKRRDL
jgi:ABC-type transport system involved in multi-copper enzyme maturation permease subunit